MSIKGRVTRRRFLQTTGAGIAAAPVFSPFVATEAFAADKSLSIVQWAHFVPEYNTKNKNFAKEWGKKNNITVTVDHIPVQNVPARAAAEASAQSGHDLFGFNGARRAPHKRKII